MTADTDNPLVLEILTASSTAYSYYTDEKITEVHFDFLFLCFCKETTVLYEKNCLHVITLGESMVKKNTVHVFINPFVPSTPFLYSSENIRKPYGFLLFSEGRERMYWK